MLSYRTLGTRMSQVDDILKRKVTVILWFIVMAQGIDCRFFMHGSAWQTDTALFSLDEEETGKHESNEESDAAKDMQRKEKIVKELLKKVKKRRKLVRSYSYFSWFCAFFACFLGNLYIKAVCRCTIPFTDLNMITSRVIVVYGFWWGRPWYWMVLFAAIEWALVLCRRVD